MCYFCLAMLKTGHYNTWFLCGFRLIPLLQFNNDDLFFLLGIQTRDDKINTFSSQGDLIFNGNSDLIGKFWNIDYLIHILH